MLLSPACIQQYHGWYFFSPLKFGSGKSLPVAMIPVGTWFSAVYLGEHYLIDVLGGIAYGTVAFIAVEKLLPNLSSRVSFLRKHVPTEKKPIA